MTTTQPDTTKPGSPSKRYGFDATDGDDDGPHPAMSDAIRRWVDYVQDRMPVELRHSQEWRKAAVGLAGSAASPAVESARRDLITDWMWLRFGDEAVVAAVPESARPSWDRMLSERTSTAAREASRKCYDGDFSGGPEAMCYADAASRAAADAAATVDGWYAAANPIRDAITDAIAAQVASNADRAGYWARANPAALLTQLCAMGSERNGVSATGR